MWFRVGEYVPKMWKSVVKTNKNKNIAVKPTLKAPVIRKSYGGFFVYFISFLIIIDKMKPIHYVILFAVAGLIYLLCFAKCKQSGGNGDISKSDMIARITKEVCDIEAELKKKYGDNSPPPDDPNVQLLKLEFELLVAMGVKSMPQC